MKTRVRVKRGVLLSHNIWWGFVEKCLEDFFGSGDRWVKFVTLSSALEGNHNFRSSHYEARAWDVSSIKGWSTHKQKRVARDLEFYLENRAKEEGKSWYKFYCRFHGKPLHYHIQVRRGVDP